MFPYIVYASSKGSGETSLAWGLAAYQCNKTKKLMCWLMFIFCFSKWSTFWTIVARQKGQDKLHRPRPDCFWISLIRVFLVCYSNKYLVNSSPGVPTFYLRTERYSVWNFRTFTVIGFVWFKLSSKITYWPFQGGTSFVDLLCFSVLRFALPLWSSVYICLVVTYWERSDLLGLVCGV